ncbi:coiled-coil domain-containing protein 194 [Prionailurus iriomotensis]
MQSVIIEAAELLEEGHSACFKDSPTGCRQAVDGGMAELGPEPGRAWRVLALCGAAVFLAAAAAGGALLAWNLASSASRGPRCPEAGANATAPPRDLAPEVEELRRQLAEATQRQEALARQLNQANRARRELEEALRACEGRQSRLQTQLMTLKTEIEEAKAQGTQMGAENGALTVKPWKPRWALSAECRTPDPAPGPDRDPAPAHVLAQELRGAAGGRRGALEEDEENFTQITLKETLVTDFG